jgi:hypothetical protein
MALDLNRLINTVAQIDEDRSNMHKRLYDLTEALITWLDTDQGSTADAALAKACKLAGGSARPDKYWGAK